MCNAAQPAAPVPSPRRIPPLPGPALLGKERPLSARERDLVNEICRKTSTLTTEPWVSEYLHFTRRLLGGWRKAVWHSTVCFAPTRWPRNIPKPCPRTTRRRFPLRLLSPECTHRVRTPGVTRPGAAGAATADVNEAGVPATPPHPSAPLLPTPEYGYLRTCTV